MDKGENAYVILGIPRNATDTDIKKAYRQKALQNHPDKQSTPEAKARAGRIFAKISNAYEILSDPRDRKRHDMILDASDSSSSGSDDSSYSSDSDSSSSSVRKSSPPPPQPASKPKQQPAPEAARKADNTPPKKTSTELSTDVAGRKPKKTTGNDNGPTSPPPSQSRSMPTKESDNENDRHRPKAEPYDAKKFHDPYDVFSRVFREEFGEDPYELLTGKKDGDGVTPTPAKDRKTDPVVTKFVEKDDESSGWSDDDDDPNPPVAMSCRPKTIIKPDGVREVVSELTITRADGTKEVQITRGGAPGGPQNLKPGSKVKMAGGTLTVHDVSNKPPELLDDDKAVVLGGVATKKKKPAAKAKKSAPKQLEQDPEQIKASANKEKKTKAPKQIAQDPEQVEAAKEEEDKEKEQKQKEQQALQTAIVPISEVEKQNLPSPTAPEISSTAIRKEKQHQPDPAPADEGMQEQQNLPGPPPKQAEPAPEKPMPMEEAVPSPPPSAAPEKPVQAPPKEQAAPEETAPEPKEDETKPKRCCFF